MSPLGGCPSTSHPPPVLPPSTSSSAPHRPPITPISAQPATLRQRNPPHDPSSNWGPLPLWLKSFLFVADSLQLFSAVSQYFYRFGQLTSYQNKVTIFLKKHFLNRTVHQNILVDHNFRVPVLFMRINVVKADCVSTRILSVKVCRANCVFPHNKVKQEINISNFFESLNLTCAILFHRSCTAPDWGYKTFIGFRKSLVQGLNIRHLAEHCPYRSQANCWAEKMLWIFIGGEKSVFLLQAYLPTLAPIFKWQYTLRIVIYKSALV